METGLNYLYWSKELPKPTPLAGGKEPGRSRN